jgi:HAD superfamily hydrolase (TIGR01549 family)
MNGCEPSTARGERRGDASASAPSLHPLEPPPTLVLFDLDDTLCDYAGARAGRLRTAFGIALTHAVGGADVDLDQLIAESVAIHPHASDHFGPLLARYGVEDEAPIRAARAWYHANRFRGLALFADAAEILRSIRAALPGRRIGLITNGPADVQRDKIALLGLERHLDFALISGELGVAKPDPAIFREALRRGDAMVEETVFIGDSPEYDVASARAAGIRAIWMNRCGLPWPAATSPPAEARSLAEIRALLGAAPAIVP